MAHYLIGQKISNDQMMFLQEKSWNSKQNILCSILHLKLEQLQHYGKLKIALQLTLSNSHLLKTNPTCFIHSNAEYVQANQIFKQH